MKKPEGIRIMQSLAEQGVKFYFFTGANGSGKDTQANLVEATMLYHRTIAHVSTKSAIEHWMSDKSAIGEKLRSEKENLGKGVLVSDDLAADCVGYDVHEFWGKHRFKMFIVSGFPRGDIQPELVALIRGAEILSFEIPKTTSIKRAIIRAKNRKLDGLPPREDDRPTIARKRWFQHRDHTLKSVMKTSSAHGVPLKVINGDQPVRAVFKDTLEAMGILPRIVEDCLHRINTPDTNIKTILKPVEDRLVVPDHWPVRKKALAIAETIEGETGTNPLTSLLSTEGEESKWTIFLRGKLQSPFISQVARARA